MGTCSWTKSFAVSRPFPTASTTLPPAVTACSPIPDATRFTRSTGDALRDRLVDRLRELVLRDELPLLERLLVERPPLDDAPRELLRLLPPRELDAPRELDLRLDPPRELPPRERLLDPDLRLDLRLDPDLLRDDDRPDEPPDRERDLPPRDDFFVAAMFLLLSEEVGGAANGTMTRATNAKFARRRRDARRARTAASGEWYVMRGA
jgi:hypothetical protein